jgi:cytosine/adenosine deaminase-related metal-dependent hydrolase
MPPGFILHEELRITQKDGLSPAETLRTATVNAAAATGRSAEFGTVEPGKRGDLVGIEVRSRPGGGPVKVPNPLPCESTFKIRRATTSRIYIKDMVRRHRKGKKVA